jgi:hypothetical protein
MTQEHIEELTTTKTQPPKTAPLRIPSFSLGLGLLISGPGIGATIILVLAV